MSMNYTALSTGKRTRSFVCAAPRRPVYPLLTLVLAAIVVLGCSDGRPERLKVSGKVLIDGQPLPFGFVRFVPTTQRPSTGRLDENGRFTLTCYGDEDGVVPGTHAVEVAAGEFLSETKCRWHAPKKYARYKTSGLQHEITESTDDLLIELTWDGGKPFTEVEGKRKR